MKFIFYSLVLFFLSACSNNEQRFVCDSNEGLVISKDKATYQIFELNLCKKMGHVNVYSENCLIFLSDATNKEEVTFTLYFDTVAQSIIRGLNSVQCKKIN